MIQPTFPVFTSKPIIIDIYSDEIWEIEGIHGERWIYIGSIFERKDKPILPKLIEHRYMIYKPNYKQYYKQNDEIIHWNNMAHSRNKKFIAIRWLNWMLDDSQRPKERRLYFSLSAINISRLNLRKFGNKKQIENVYTRFYRSVLQYNIKKFFPTETKEVIINNIFHEEGKQKYHKYFPTSPVKKLKIIFSRSLIKIKTNRIQFLPKDHRRDKRSNILQLCDLLMGIIKDLHTKKELDKLPELKREILLSKPVKELIIDRIISRPKNRNSSYSYYNRFNISFFPKKPITYKTIERTKIFPPASFYTPSIEDFAMIRKMDQKNQLVMTVLKDYV